MTPERWKQIDALFAAALDWAVDRRSKLITEASAGDEELRREVESLLQAHDRASTQLRAPGANAGARLLLGTEGDALSGESPASRSGERTLGLLLEPGAAVDRYLLLDLLGRGGMGVVFRAYDPQLDRKVAVKLLRPDAFGNTRASEGRARLLREAQALARLSHPNVIAVFDVGTFEDQVFIAMEYIDGSTLSRWLREAERSWRAVLEVFIQAGQGVAAAHAAGLIHRDFKPDNVLVGSDGRVRVLDFGLARPAQGPSGAPGRREMLPDSALPSGSGPLAAADLTASGQIAGTPAYMSPEAVRGEPLDERSDVFSFSVTAWEALYGQLPFAGESLRELSSAAEREKMRPLPAGSRVPKVVREVLLRGLRANPADRIATMQEVLTALQKAARRGRTRLLAIAAGLVAATLAGLFWVSARSRTTNAEPPRFHRLTDSGRDHSPAASLDGQTIVFTSNREGQPRIWLKELAAGRELALTSGPDERARLSPDGSRVIFVRDQGARSSLYSATVSTGAARQIVEDASDGDFSPDGRQVAFIHVDPQTGTATRLEIASDEGGNAREIFRLESGASSLDSPRWSPDGSTIAVRQAAASTGVPDSILLVRTDGTGGRSIVPPGPPGRISALAYSASGSALIYAQSESLSSTRAHVSSRMVRLNLSTLQADTLFWVPERIQTVAPAGAQRLVFDAHSTLENLRESVIDGGGEGRPATSETEARWLTRGRSNDRQPVYSPDGEWVAFSSDRSGNLDLWKVSTRTGTVRQLTDDAADDWDPAFTRDGQKLLWSSNRSGSFEIWIADADGRGARQLTHDGVDAENPTATPDGQWIVYSSGNPTHPGIWKIRADGTSATQLVAGTTVWPEISPDGRYVVYRNAAYDWPDSRARDISMRVVQTADGALVPFEIKLRNGPSVGRARWLPDGRGVAFIGSGENGTIGVFAQDFAAAGNIAATPRRLAGFSSRGASESFNIAPDGTRITIAESEALSSVMVADRVPSR